MVHVTYKTFFNGEMFRFPYAPNPSSHTMALGSTQPLTEPARKADNLAAIYEPIV
jgi:hypothetical protein